MSNDFDFNFSAHVAENLSAFGPIITKLIARMESHGMEVLAGGAEDWAKVGERKWGIPMGDNSVNADGSSKRPYAFKHDEFIRSAFISAILAVADDHDIMVKVVVHQKRWGRNGKIRAAGVEIGIEHINRPDLAFVVLTNGSDYDLLAKAINLR